MAAIFEYASFEKIFIEWTVATPAEDDYAVSDLIIICNNEYDLVLDRKTETDVCYQLTFRSLEHDNVPNAMRVEVDLFNETRLVSSQKSIVKVPNSCIWNCSAQEMLNFVPNIQKGHLLRFEVRIRCGDFPKDDKSVQTLTHSDSHVHFESLSQDFEKLFKKDSSHDIEIMCEDRTFKVHKLLLGARSEVFAAMLTSGMVENKTGIVKIEDMEASIFQDFLRYLYTGKLPDMNLDTAKQLYVAGDKYAVHGLKKKCTSFLEHNLADDNACDTLVLADSHNDPEFKENVLAYILDQNLPRKLHHFSDFALNHPKLAVEVYGRYLALLK